MLSYSLSFTSNEQQIANLDADRLDPDCQVLFVSVVKHSKLADSQFPPGQLIRTKLLAVSGFDRRLMAQLTFTPLQYLLLLKFSKRF